MFERRGGGGNGFLNTFQKNLQNWCFGANDNREPTKQPILGVMNGLNSYAWVTSFLEHKALTPIGMIQPKK